MGSKSFTDLKVWRASHEVYLEIYHLTEGFPRRDMYRISDQMRRAAEAEEQSDELES